jgi:hypothetical protein
MFAIFMLVMLFLSLFIFAGVAAEIIYSKKTHKKFSIRHLFKM